MPDDRRRATGRSSGSRTGGTGKPRGTAAGRARGASSGGARGASSSRGKPPASRRQRPIDDLEPLDLEGSDFEELLEASHGPSEPARAEVEEIEPERPWGPGIEPRLAPGIPKDVGFDPAPDTSIDESAVSMWGQPDAASIDEQASLEVARPRDELLVAVLGFLLAGSTLLTWYADGAGFRKLTGLASGSFAAVVFACGIAAGVIAALRRMGKVVRFPYETGIVLEVLGYAAVGSVILKRIGPFRPDGMRAVNLGTLSALGLGILLALVASRLSANAPFVSHPGWLAQQGGHLGAMILVGTLAVAGGAAILKPGAGATSSTPQNSVETTTEPPACATEVDFQVPGVLMETKYYTSAAGQLVACSGSAASEASVKEVAKRWAQRLREAGWTIDPPQITAGVASIALKKPRCGSITVHRQLGTAPGQDGRAQAAWSFYDCTLLPSAPPN